jgi:Family of unknown function (DUF5681)
MTGKRTKPATQRATRYAHLKGYQFKPGTSGNPKGRPKGRRNRVNHRVGLDKLVEIIHSKRAPAAVQLRATRIFVEVIMRAAGLWDA